MVTCLDKIFPSQHFYESIVTNRNTNTAFTNRINAVPIQSIPLIGNLV